jgi:hypothetical protein
MLGRQGIDRPPDIVMPHAVTIPTGSGIYMHSYLYESIK